VAEIAPSKPLPTARTKICRAREDQVMGKKRVPAKGTKSGLPEKAPPLQSDLSSAVKALHEAAQSLAATADQMAQMMQQMAGPSSGTGDAQETAAAPSSAADMATKPLSSNGPTAIKDEDAKSFYERLEQTGQLADVDDKTDLSALPPRVTHIRRPDGSIQRLGFSASSYTRK
jgi:hypothetical protein